MLTPNEIINLTPKAIELVEALRAALAADGDGARKITRAEARQIVLLCGELALGLVRDVLD